MDLIRYIQENKPRKKTNEELEQDIEKLFKGQMPVIFGHSGELNNYENFMTVLEHICLHSNPRN